MELFFLAIFFLLFIQLFIGFIINFISAYNKYGFHYEHFHTEEDNNYFNHFFEFNPIYKNKALKKLVEDNNIEGYKLSMELKYLMAIFCIGMSINHLLNLFERYFTKPVYIIIKMKDYIELFRSLIVVTILAYIIIKSFIVFISILRKYKSKREYLFCVKWLPLWYKYYEVDINSKEFIKDNKRIQNYFKEMKYLLSMIIITLYASFVLLMIFSPF